MDFVFKTDLPVAFDTVDRYDRQGLPVQTTIDLPVAFDTVDRYDRQGLSVQTTIDLPVAFNTVDRYKPPTDRDYRYKPR